MEKSFSSSAIRRRVRFGSDLELGVGPDFASLSQSSLGLRLSIRTSGFLAIAFWSGLARTVVIIIVYL